MVPCSGGENEKIDTTQMLLYSKNERIYCIVIVSNLKDDLAKSFPSVHELCLITKCLLQ